MKNFIVFFLLLIFIINFIICIYIIKHKLSYLGLEAKYSKWKANKTKIKKLQCIESAISDKIKYAYKNGEYYTILYDFDLFPSCYIFEINLEKDLFNNENNKNYIKNQLEKKGYKVEFGEKDFFYKIDVTRRRKFIKVSWSEDNK